MVINVFEVLKSLHTLRPKIENKSQKSTQATHIGSR